MQRPVIGFCGYAGSGKSVVANHLVEAYGFRRTRFAGPLKRMMRALGLNERQVDGDLKEVPCALLGGKTPRQAMQTIGTEWGRMLISPTIWTDAWRSEVDGLAHYVPVVADDVRFDNEAELLRSMGALVVEIDRPGLQRIAASGHVSEKIPDADMKIVNDGSVADLIGKVDSLVLSMEL